MKIGILTIGNELMNGRISDTNASFIAREANLQGWSVEAIMSVGDDFALIKNRLDYLLSMTDAVICSGGLGPTSDDITTAAIAEAFGLPLHTDESVLNFIKDIFTKFNFKWVENNAKQAMFPKGAEILPNARGTAPGFSLSLNGKFIFVIPGVPAEAKLMVTNGVIPALRRHFPQKEQYIVKQTIRTFGLSEAAVDEQVKDIDFDSLGVNIGFYPVFPENHIVLIARSRNQDEARNHLQKAQNEVSAHVQDYIFAYGEQTLEEVIADLLTEKKLTISVAESCTGGMIASRLTDVSGSSNYFERGLVTYSNAAKISMLGVPAEVIEKHGAVSEETARLMAEGVRRLAGTDLGLSSTGIAGPTGGSKEKPVGTVYIALADAKQTICRHYSYRWDRQRNKEMFSEAALFLLNNYLQGKLT
ncbi:MAG: competence/damage-inducible protein A [Deltaproteobacteria bacterium HGW-Deltaproteobacteria-13]|jgi:nicotinamide-nucleotide amidase|nr:MAG: competence/damage-inducible protein A [Deltaproteobacteria bacterium HGW-Deltaproteobacteria-13]